MEKRYDEYIKSAIERMTDSQVDFLQLKKKLSKQYGVPIPTNADLRDRYNTLVSERKIKRSIPLEKILLSRAVRTQSGVAVVAVLTKAYPCPGKCIYCPSEKDMPKSYLSNEPAVMRAIDSHFDPYRQVANRLRSLELNGHSTDKIELIVMGGTFSFLPKAYQKKFILRCFQAANEYGKVHNVHKVIKFIKSNNTSDQKILYEQKINETAKHRIVGLTLETRPDYIDEKEIINFRQLGCTRVELGVQSLFDDVLKINNRGHLVDATIRATKLLKDAGFKINYHMMPGLPGSTPARDFKMFKELFSNSDFQPDMLKIYPTVVLKNSQLYDIWKKTNETKNKIIHITPTDVKCRTIKIDRYNPLTNKQFEKLVVKIKNEAIPPYVRIARLVRDVPTSSIVAGPTVSNLRQIIIPQSHCPCIRCREVKGNYIIKESTILDRIDYAASDGKEIFLQYVSSDKQKLFALLRLRIPSSCHFEHPLHEYKLREAKSRNLDSDPSTTFRSIGLNFAQDDTFFRLLPTLKNSAIIREVHTYGKMTKIDELDSTSPQHIGLGKKLLLEAERITKEEFGLSKIVVISGVGVRGYYRKAGYKLQNTYMVKKL